MKSETCRDKYILNLSNGQLEKYLFIKITIPKSLTLNNVKRTIDIIDGYITLSEEPKLDIENVLFQDASEGVKFARKSDHCHELHEFCDAVTYTQSMPSFEEIFSNANSAKRFRQFVSMAYVNDNKRIELHEINPCCSEYSFEKGQKFTFFNPCGESDQLIVQ